MERPWIEHDGSGCPVARGTMVEAIDRRGVVAAPFPAMTLNALSCRPSQDTRGSAWVWGSNPFWPELEVTHWRLFIDPQAEADRVNARQAMFHDWRMNPDQEPTGPEDQNPVKKPAKAVR